MGSGEQASICRGSARWASAWTLVALAVVLAGCAGSSDPGGGEKSDGTDDGVPVRSVQAALAPPGSNGAPCSSASECTSGFCVDGVCCNTACGGGVSTDCQACSASAGSSIAEGTCGKVSAGFTCRGATDACDAAEVCSGTSTACPVDKLMGNATVCRAAAPGGCDVAEKCTGTSKACPADTLRPTTFRCRAAVSACDVSENCTGASPQCPPDGFQPTTKICRSAATKCDVAENCTGVDAVCPPDAVAPAGLQCRGASAACDVPESCDGTTTACPADAFALPDKVCRVATTMCDVTEMCTGSTKTCPPDAVATAATVCRAAAGGCDAVETCTGSSKTCPSNKYSPSTTVCRAATHACDASEKCTGTSASCPANQSAPNGTGCNDGDGCTQTDACQAGACMGANPVACTASDQCHDTGTCDPSTGACSNPAKADGTGCDDGNGCTQTDACQGGSCGGANPVECSAADQCHDPGTCDPSTGACSNPTKADGTGCDDGSLCTQSDSCQAGVCNGANPVACTASDQCHDAGTCDPSTGACSNPAKADGTGCDDGSLCTQSDSCQAGVCNGANPVVCLATDQCHDTGTCDPSTGACSNSAKADGTGCDDGSRCTQNDYCRAGACTGATPVVCQAADQCHDAGTCDLSTGVCSDPAKADGTGCDDSNGCTLEDSCRAGQCTGGQIRFDSCVPCQTDAQCATDQQCDPFFQVCVDCVTDAGCSAGEHCDTATNTCIDEPLPLTLVWRNCFDSGADDYVGKLALDTSGFVYATGFQGGPSNWDARTVAYSPAGAEVWNASYDSGFHDFGHSVAPAANGGVVVTVDVQNQQSQSPTDIHVIRYEQDGTQAWVRAHDNSETPNGLDFALGAVTDASGDVYLAQIWQAEGDYYTNRVQADQLLVKLDSGGNFISQQTLLGPTYMVSVGDVEIDSAGNLYILHFEYDDYRIKKYDPTTASLVWDRSYAPGVFDYPSGMAVDGAGNVNVTGFSTDNGSYQEAVLLHYDSDGTLQWDRRYQAGGYASGNDVAVDAAGNVYLLATSYANVNRSGPSDIRLVSFSSAGTQRWEIPFDGGGDDAGASVAVDAAGNVYVGVSSHNGVDFDSCVMKYSVPCQTDAQCAPDQQCDPLSQICVDCVTDAGCSAGEHCDTDTNTCTEAGSCPAGLVAAYAFDSGTVDDVAGPYDGSLNAGYGSIVAGRVGLALSTPRDCSGPSKYGASVPGFTDLTTGSLSFEASIAPHCNPWQLSSVVTIGPVTSPTAYILSIGTTYSHGGYSGGSTYYFEFAIHTGAGGYAPIRSAREDYACGVYHHVIGSFDRDAGKLRIWVDGELGGEADDVDATTQARIGTLRPNSTLYMGGAPFESGCGWGVNGGTLDALGVYSAGFDAPSAATAWTRWQASDQRCLTP